MTTKTARKMQQLLEEKHQLLTQMEQVLQSAHLSAKNDSHRNLIDCCREVENIISRLKDTDYEIARLEARCDLKQICDPEGEKVTVMIDSIIELADTVRTLVTKLTIKGSKIRNRLRKELGNVISSSQVAGYAPPIEQQAVYFDRHS